MTLVWIGLLIVLLVVGAYVRQRAYGPTRRGERVWLRGIGVVRYGDDAKADAEIDRRAAE